MADSDGQFKMFNDSFFNLLVHSKKSGKVVAWFMEQVKFYEKMKGDESKSHFHY